MNVGDIMTREPNVAHVDDTLEHAARVMWECDCGFVPVLDDAGRIVGTVTDRDICMAAYIKGRTLHELYVSEAMAREPLTCTEDDSIGRAEQLMQTAKIRRVPVTEDGGRLVGMITLSDIARAEADAGRNRADAPSAREVCQTLRAVTERRLHA